MNRLRRPRHDVALLLVLGLGIRELFSFWTGHPFDTEIWLRNAYYVAHGWNPYSLMPPVSGVSFAYTGNLLPSVGYLPLWSLLLAGLYQLYALVPGGTRFLLYLLVKQPPILGDTALGALIFKAAMRWGAPRRVARRLLELWMVFPYPILISAIWGQFDSMVAALVLASVLAASSWKRFGFVGLGVLLKLFPIIFVPYGFLQTKGRSRWSTILAVAIPASFTAGVFAVTGWGLQAFSGTLVWEAHGSPQGMTYGGLLSSPLVAGAASSNATLFYLLGDLWIPGVLLGGAWAHRRFAGESPAAVLQAFVWLTVLLFLLRWTVNEQYLVYLLPLLLLDVAVWHPERRGLFHLTWVLATSFLVLNNFFLIRFGAPAFPAALAVESALQADPLFGVLRPIVLDVIGLLFTIHLIQLGLVVANPSRPATPWSLRLLQRTWSESILRVRSITSGRGG